MERISQRKSYDFDSIENYIRSIILKGHPESISRRGEKSGEVRIPKYFFLYNTVLPVTFKIGGFPRAARLLKTLFPFDLE